MRTTQDGSTPTLSVPSTPAAPNILEASGSFKSICNQGACIGPIALSPHTCTEQSHPPSERQNLLFTVPKDVLSLFLQPPQFGF